MNKTIISLAACALVLIAGLSVKPAMAYFTATASANGQASIAIDDTHADITESGGGQVKVISVANTQETPCYVRVAVLMPESISAAFSGEGWSYNADDQYYYYSEILAAGETAEALTLTIDTRNALADEKLNYADFQVIVIPESAKVLYDADGKPYAGWNEAIWTETEGGN
jgi:hypothetical protein